jgi:hypothetical protein
MCKRGERKGKKHKEIAGTTMNKLFSSLSLQKEESRDFLLRKVLIAALKIYTKIRSGIGILFRPRSPPPPPPPNTQPSWFAYLHVVQE